MVAVAHHEPLYSDDKLRIMGTGNWEGEQDWLLKVALHNTVSS